MDKGRCWFSSCLMTGIVQVLWCCKFCVAGDLFLWALDVGRSPWGNSSCVQRGHRAKQSYKQPQRNLFIRKGHFDSRVFNDLPLKNLPTILSSSTHAEDGFYPQGSEVFIKPKKYEGHIIPRNGDLWQVLGKNVFCCRLNIFNQFLGRFFLF